MPKHSKLIILIPSCAYTGIHVSTEFSTLPGLSAMLFTKQEKGQENQASQQKSLSSLKKNHCPPRGWLF